MLVPLSWLKKYVDIKDDTKTFCDKITKMGMAVETVEEIGGDISNVLVGKILSVDKHPDADKLVITKIDMGSGEPLQIVTGAKNVYPGAVVPVAVDGANLANGVKIKKGKLRGEISEGMLVSVEELGFTKNDYPESPEDGIYIFLGEEPALGSDAVDALSMRETVIDFDLTSNRVDCFSVIGMAREAAAAVDSKVNYPSAVPVEKINDVNINDLITVEIKNSELCPRYIARVIKNVKIEPSPLWMRHCLSTAGIRPINNIVDITNFVMLEYGQPMHAFDIDCVNGGIIVRNAEAGEILTTLDGEERKLDPSMLVIADKERAVALAGVMGGENSKITGGAQAILLESANFNGTNIRLTSKKLGLRTDSSGKFERGLDPNLALEAVNRAAALIEELCCGEVVKGMVDCYPNKREAITIEYKPEKINALLGTDIPASDMEKFLARVHIKAENEIAQIPTYRADMTCQSDIAEEVARVFGYDNIPVTLASGRPTSGAKTQRQKMEESLKNVMTAQGFCEALTYAFESDKAFDKLLIPAESDIRKAIVISNPLNEDYGIMRTTSLNSMLASLALNFNRRNEEAALFELAKIYIPKSLPLDDMPNEIPVLTFGMYGAVIDFFDVKGVAETIFASFGVKNIEFTAEKELPFMHPGRCANVSTNGKNIGFIGEIHPTVAANYEIGTKAYAAVIYLNELFENAELISTYKPLPKYPGTKRDIAMLVNDEVPVADIENVIAERGGKILEGVKLFDVYKGEHTPEGKKSVAYSIYFRASDRTLTDEDVNNSMGKILAELEKKTGAVLRS